MTGMRKFGRMPPVVISSALLLAATTALACSGGYAIWIPRSRSADPLYRFVEGNKAGYIDATGKIVIPPKLAVFGNSGDEFHEGLLNTGSSEGKFIDRKGQPVTYAGLYRVWEFSEGLAAAMEVSRWGYIDRTGKFAIPPRFRSSRSNYAHSFSDGLALIETDGKFGYIDHSGSFVIPAAFLDATDFNDGMAAVVTDGPCIYFPDGACGMVNPRFPGGDTHRDFSVSACQFKLIDKKGSIIGGHQFSQIRQFNEGLAPVRIGAFWGFVDRTGTITIKPEFEDAESFSSGLARVLRHGLYGYVDKRGELRITPQFKQAESFNEGLAVVGNNYGRFWYVDPQGKPAIQDEFAIASPFFHGIAHVRLPPRNEKDTTSEFAYIDKTGRQIFRYKGKY